MNCSRCKQPRSYLDFARHNGKRSGRQSYCRACNTAAQREWYRRTRRKTLHLSRLTGRKVQHEKALDKLAGWFDDERQRTGTNP